MLDHSLDTQQSDSQLDRIERKLDEVLMFRDQLQQLMSAFSAGGTAKLLQLVSKRGGGKS